MFARVTQITGVVLVVALGLFGTLFVVGETLADPGGWKGIGLVVTWVVPLAGLSLLALLKPDLGARVLPVVLVLVGAWAMVDAFGEFVDKDNWGPVDTISLFVVAIPSGLLGVRWVRRAGLLLLGAAAVQLVSTVAGMDREGGESFGSALGGSTGVLVVPFLLTSLVFLLADALEHAAHRHQRPSSAAR